MIYFVSLLFCCACAALRVESSDDGTVSLDRFQVQREKRQSSPSFPQSAYSFYVQVCAPSALVGQVTATGAGYYSIDTASPSVSINPYTGQLLLANYFTGPTTFQIVVRAFPSQAFFPNGISSIATVTVVITSCAGGSPNSGSQGNGNTGQPIFTQSSYGMTMSNCGTQGAGIGTVTLVNPNGATTSFAISSATPPGLFSIDSTGLISPTTGNSIAFPKGQVYLTVTATNPYGTSNSNVMITINCPNSNTANTDTGGASTGSCSSAPTFTQPFFNFPVTNCMAGAPVAAVSVTCSTGVYFAMSPTTSNPCFAVSSNGLITATGGNVVPVLRNARRQSFVVTATNVFGSSSATVVLSLNCNQYNGPVIRNSAPQNDFSVR